MRESWRCGAIVAVWLLAAAGCSHRPASTGGEPQATPPGMGETTPSATFTYTCEDHPDVKQDKPGKCPQCDKYLVVVTPPGKRAVYACQNPDTECGIYSNRPGPCPKCGQPLGCSEIVDDTSANQPNGDDKQVPDSESPNDDSPQADK